MGEGSQGRGGGYLRRGGGRGADWGVVPVVALSAWRSRRVGCLGWLLGGWGAGVLVVRGLAVVSVCNGRLSFNLV